MHATTAPPYPASFAPQVPIVVICTHFDAVQQREPEELKALAKSMRALCHMHNASVMFLSTSDRAR